MKARECPLLSLVTTAICTCPNTGAMKGRNGKYSPKGVGAATVGTHHSDTDFGVGDKMLCSEQAGTAQLLPCVHFCKWFMPGTSRGLGLGALLTVVTGVTSALAGDEDLGTFYLQETGYCYGYCMKNKLLLNHSLKCLPWSFHDAAFIFQ